jgi:hypothetical protein
VAGIETGKFAAYHRIKQAWVPIQRTTPLPVHYDGEYLFIKNEDVVFTNCFEEMLEWDDGEDSGLVEPPAASPEVIEISSDEEKVTAPSPSPSNRKGKGRAF